MTVRRPIVWIDERRCDGCGLCVPACEEGAIRIVGGKARLVGEALCDGLGACLGHCPRDAIRIVERDAAPFDGAAVQEAGGGGRCPGQAPPAREGRFLEAPAGPSAGLANWPVQLRLVSPDAPCFRGADVVVAADCVAFACRDFHERLLAGRPLAVACPKLDDQAEAARRLEAIVRRARPRRLTVAVMALPCCAALVRLVRAALAAAGSEIPLEQRMVSLGGQIAAGSGQAPHGGPIVQLGQPERPRERA